MNDTLCTTHSRLTVDSQTSDAVTLSIDGGQIFLQVQPFRLDFLSEGEPLISLNSRGLLKVEQQRKLEEPP